MRLSLSYHCTLISHNFLLIRFNKLKEIKVGSEEVSSVEELQCKYEHLGLGNINRGISYTQYYPITDVGWKTIKDEIIYDWTCCKAEDADGFDVHDDAGAAIEMNAAGAALHSPSRL